MFEFDNSILFVLATKDVVTVLKNLADMEKGVSTPKFQSVEVKNTVGLFQGVAFFSKGHPVVIYSQDLVITQPEPETKDVEKQEDSSPAQG